jgi:sec-independent protein translocase protein TatA
MPSLGPPELLVILVIVLIFFGVGRLPEVGGALGKGLSEFRKASAGIEDKPATKESPKETDGDELE